MLNQTLDIAALRTNFAQARRIRIANMLTTADAQAIATEMARLPYKLFCANGKGDPLNRSARGKPANPG